jgi:hypothetical protein
VYPLRFLVFTGFLVRPGYFLACPAFLFPRSQIIAGLHSSSHFVQSHQGSPFDGWAKLAHEDSRAINKKLRTRAKAVLYTKRNGASWLQISKPSPDFSMLIIAGEFIIPMPSGVAGHELA